MTPAELLHNLAALSLSTQSRGIAVDLALAAVALTHTEGSEAPLDPGIVTPFTVARVRGAADGFDIRSGRALPDAVGAEIARALRAAADTLESATATLEEPTP